MFRNPDKPCLVRFGVAARKPLVPLVCAALGFVVGAFVYPGPYRYGEVKGATFRVNRLTGVQEFASSKGWVSEREMMQESMRSVFGAMSLGSDSPVRPASNGEPE